MPLTDYGLPLIRTSLAFGDARVDGRIKLNPSNSSPIWEYYLDLDDDGSFEESGTLTSEISFPYSFSATGVHRLQILLKHGGTQMVFERFVVVNDPGAVVLRRQVTLEAVQGVLYGGIAISPHHNSLYVGSQHGDNMIRRLSLPELTLETARRLPGMVSDYPEGMEFDETQGRLYLVRDNGGLSSLDPVTLEVVDTFEFPDAHNPGATFVQIADGRIFASGSGLLSLEHSTGEVLRTRSEAGLWHFSVAPDGSALAVVELARESGGENSVHLVDPQSLEDLWTTDLDFQPFVVAFSSTGSHLYVIGNSAEGLLLALIERSSGDLLRRSVIHPEGALWLDSETNPVARSADGRFVAVSTSSGTYFIDTTTHLVRYRTIEPPLPDRLGCCNVASGPSGSLFYVSGGGTDGKSISALEVVK